jgi:hypothetical protein
MHENYDERVGAAYRKYYEARSGLVGDSGFVLYRGGSREQQGDGIGDILRGALRFLLPALFKGASTFVGETLNANEKGASLGDAAKSALMPALNAAVSRVQKGRGTTHRRKKVRASRSSGTEVAHDQAGSGKAKRVYKRVSEKRMFTTADSQLGGGTAKRSKKIHASRSFGHQNTFNF